MGRSWWLALVPSICMSLVLAGSVRADSRVGLDGNVSKAMADIVASPSPPYLASMVGSADPPWVTGWLEDPTSLSNTHSVHAESEAWFVDPFDATDPYDLLPISFTVSTDGSITYSVTPGQLHARADASASLSPSSYTAVPPDSRPPVTITSPYFGGTFAGVGIYYMDELSFTSGSLAIGSPIEIEVTLRHDTSVLTSSGLGGGPPYPNHAYAETRLKLLTFDANWNSTGLGGDPIAVLREEVINGTPVRDDADQLVFNFDVAVGDNFFVQQSLEIWARAMVDANFSQAVSLADSSNTAGIYFRSLTEGVSIQSLSGNSYAEPVPEPGSALLGAAALAALTGLRRRARRA